MEPTDGERLAAFVERGDEAAFEEVVRRHEALVLSVCARVLGDAQDARDAAQAVFLALARKALRLDLGRPLGPWLHHVAFGVAANARKSREARRARERKAMERITPPTERDLSGDLRPLLDEEMDRLPDRYRRPLVLFHLEGRSLEEIASALRSSVGTVGAWLSRGRHLLRDRLVRRGVTALSVGTLVAFLAREAAACTVGLGFARSTARVVAGKAAVSGEVSIILEGALKMFFMAKVKAAAVTAFLAVLGVGASFFGISSGAPGPAPLEAAEAELPVPAPVSGPSAPEEEQAEEVPARSSELVGHWKLDDEKLADSSGHGHSGKVSGTVLWTDGKAGRALQLDGKGGHVALPNSEALDRVNEGSFSVAAWFKPADVPPGKESANDAHYGIVMKAGWHVGLSYSHEQKFQMDYWIEGPDGENPKWSGTGAWEEECAPGQWYHLAGVVDRPAGKTLLFINGELKNTEEWDNSKGARKYGAMPWRIGVGNPGAEQWAWPARGAIDDVRIYNRALSPLDVKSLCEGK
jgi:RNA polymerase sigma factor (sigma-70 family)